MHRGRDRLDGRELLPAVVDASDLELVAPVSRSAAGQDLGEALGGEALGIAVNDVVSEALEGVDVLGSPAKRSMRMARNLVRARFSAAE